MLFCVEVNRFVELTLLVLSPALLPIEEPNAAVCLTFVVLASQTLSFDEVNAPVWLGPEVKTLVLLPSEKMNELADFVSFEVNVVLVSTDVTWSKLPI